MGDLGVRAAIDEITWGVMLSPGILQRKQRTRPAPEGVRRTQTLACCMQQAVIKLS